MIDIEDIDKEEFLAGVAELAEEAGDWRNHLPYEALCNFKQCDEIRDQYGAHVDDCLYCQELISLFSSK